MSLTGKNPNSPYFSSSFFSYMKKKKIEKKKEPRIFLDVFVYVYFLKVNLFFCFVLVITRLPFSVLRLQISVSTVVFPFHFVWSWLSSHLFLSHEMWIFQLWSLLQLGSCLVISVLVYCGGANLQKTPTLSFSGTETSPSSGAAFSTNFCNPLL